MHYVAIHIIQSVPPANINRDDSGSPKSTVYGGVRRARVSSQSWKRATREAFKGLLPPEAIGTRTKDIAKLVAEEIRKQDGGVDYVTAVSLAEGVLKACGFKLSAPKAKDGEEPAPEQSGYLMFLSHVQVEKLAAAALAARQTEDSAAYYKKIKVKTLVDQDHSVDIALFGRMVADAPDLGVDAACQVAHALGVHALHPEFDYFTAVDDLQKDDESGAGMIGTIEYNASTYYRYAVINVDLLRENLGHEAATREAIAAFVEAFTTSMPTGKRNTFANGTLPSAVVVAVGEGQPSNLSEAFEVPVKDSARGYVEPAAEALRDYATDLFNAWGRPAVVLSSALPKARAVLELGETVAFSDLGRRAAEVAVVAS